MLSAVAARKAAQAAACANAENESQTFEQPVPLLTTDSGSEEDKPTFKRKSREGHVGSGQQKKQRRAERTKTSRYFAEKGDSFKSQADLIVVESDEESIVTGGGDTSMTVDGLDLIPPPATHPWSPSMPLPDSSDEDEELVAEGPEIPVRDLTTFKPIANRTVFHVTQDVLLTLDFPFVPGTLIVLSPAETVCIGGTYQLTVLQGTVSCLGINLPASSKVHHIYAPKSSPLPVIEALSSEPTVLNVTSSHQLGLVDVLGAIILIQELHTGIQGLGRICKIFSGVFDFMYDEARQWEEKIWEVPGAYVLRKQERYYEPYVSPTSWTAALENLAPPPSGGVYLVKGAKKSGKSTFARTLLNNLLIRFERVAYLECDPGQSEFTPGGMVALNIVQNFCFGPPFTHPTIPNSAHYVGGTTPRSSPAHYLASIQALFQTYELDVRNPLLPYASSMDTYAHEGSSVRISDVIPLVVNTMGWNKGLGADLTRQIQEIVQPTHIFEFSIPGSLGNYNDDVECGFEPASQFHVNLEPITLPPNSPLQTQYTPADNRSINILSYLHATFPHPVFERLEPSTISLEQISADSWRTDLPLCSQAPYAVDWQAALDRIVLVGSGAEDVIPADVGHVLNGALVGIVSSWGDDSRMPAQDLSKSQDIPLQMPYVQGDLPPPPISSTCLGLALIRSVSHCSPLAAPRVGADIEKELHVLTPLPLSTLKYGRVFVKGEMELPVWGMLDYTDKEDWRKGIAGIEWGKVPYLQWKKGDGVGAERRRVRRNLMRRTQV